MSLTMTKADGVTVLTLTTGPESSCPPLCQILKGLFYSPVCCSVSQHLRRVQRYYQSLLGVSYKFICLKFTCERFSMSLWKSFSMVAAVIKYRLFVGHITVFPPLQALHIMIGLLNIGLGEILISSGATWWQMDESEFRYWLGGMVSKLLLYFLSLRNSHNTSLPKLNTACSTDSLLQSGW